MTTEQLKAKIKKLFFADHCEAEMMPGVLNAMVDSSVPPEVTDITAIPRTILDDIKPGQAIIKVTGKQRHTYFVTYKGDGAGEGICISYFAAGLIETVSYDRTDSGWSYNSTDKWQQS